MKLSQTECVILLLLLVWAAWLRLGWVGVNSFSFDEARVSDMALQMVREGDFAELGMQSSTGVPNFPAAIWLFGIPYRLSTNPLLATWFVGVANVLAVVGVWWLARSAWGVGASFVAALLFATSPYLVFYARNIWSQDWLVPLAVLWAVAGVQGIKKPHQGWLGLHLFLAGFTGQVHIAGLVLAPVSAWLVFRFRLWRQWPALLTGGGLALITAMPTIYTILRFGEGAKAELRALLQQPSVTDWHGFTQLGALAVNQTWERFWLNDQWQWAAPWAVLLPLSRWLLGLFLLLGTGWVLWRAVRERQAAVAADGIPSLTPGRVLTAFLFLWAVVTPLFFLRGKTGSLIHYQLVSLPALILLMGAAAAVSRKGWWVGSIGGLAVMIAVVQSATIAQALTIVQREQVPGGMGTPLAYPQQAIQTLETTDYPIVVETYGDIPEFEGDAAVFKVLLWDYPRQIVDARSALLIPDEPAHLFFTYDNLPAWEIAQAVGLVGTRRDLPRRLNEAPYVAFTVTDVTLAGFHPAPPGQLANGAVLQGWQVQPLGEARLRLLTYWRLGQELVPDHFQQFNHLYVVGVPEPVQVQDNYTSSRAWQEGDHLITWAEFEKPEALIAHFHVGMYTWPDLQRSPVLNQADPVRPIQLDWADAYSSAGLE